MSSNSREINSRAKSRARKACKRCRQAKARCVFDTVPCARCQLMGLDCEWDPEFKRKKNEDRVEILEQEVRRLQGVTAEERRPGYEQRPADHSSAPGQVPVNSAGPRLGAGGNGARDDLVPVGLPTSQSIASAPLTSSFTVLDITLSSESAASLFAIFFDKYHRHLPFLEPTQGADECHHQSKLLFWTIISVAARNLQVEKDFLKRLTPYLKDSLGQMVLETTTLLGDIQALLLLALWPPYNTRFWSDRSMTLANLAMTGAIYRGLHNPKHEQEYRRTKVEMTDTRLMERMRTWVACFSITQQLAIDFGLPYTLLFDHWTIVNLCGSKPSVDIPVDLLHNLMIQRTGYYAFAPLAGLDHHGANTFDDTILFAILEKSDREMEQLCTLHLSLLNKMRLSAVRVHLQCMYFQLNHTNPQRKAGILQAYSTATDLIDMAVSGDSSTNILSYSPRSTYRMLQCAACVIFKVLHSSYRSEVDFNHGKLLYNAAVLCIRQQAVQHMEDDLPSRIADILRLLWDLGANTPNVTASAPELTVKTRLGASVSYDCLAIYFDHIESIRRSQRKEMSEVMQASLQDEQQQLEGRSPRFGSSMLESNILEDFPTDFPMDFPAWNTDLSFSDLNIFA